MHDAIRIAVGVGQAVHTSQCLAQLARDVDGDPGRHRARLALCATHEAEGVDPHHVLHRQIGLAVDLARLEHLDHVGMPRRRVQACFDLECAAPSRIIEHRWQQPFDDELRRGRSPYPGARQVNLGHASDGYPLVQNVGAELNGFAERSAISRPILERLSFGHGHQTSSELPLALAVSRRKSFRFGTTRSGSKNLRQWC